MAELLLPDGRAVWRLQLRRTRGWRLPEGAIKVDRTTRWGNPFRIDTNAGIAAVDAVAIYVRAMTCPGYPGCRGWHTTWHYPTPKPRIDEIRAALGGHDLACWCKVGDPCHADWLLKTANPDAVAIPTF